VLFIESIVLIMRSPLFIRKPDALSAGRPLRPHQAGKLAGLA
jgi:hypothetical protein